MQPLIALNLKWYVFYFAVSYFADLCNGFADRTPPGQAMHQRVNLSRADPRLLLSTGELWVSFKLEGFHLFWDNVLN